MSLPSWSQNGGKNSKKIRRIHRKEEAFLFLPNHIYLLAQNDNFCAAQLQQEIQDSQNKLIYQYL